ncbi:MAG: hypothetical protein A2Y25_00660 [Candidatus Melainabacteria bacterium GWF2_37_15]|nr:MAG: hypothetical protein A2Y25_00660 [Candidatus Melainabacteria bacterium GWF2_37_15]
MNTNKRKGTILVLFALLGAFLLAGAMAGFMYLQSLPSIEQLEQYEPTLTSQIVSNDDVVIRTFGAYKYNRVSINQVPDNMKNAITSIEDKNFYRHSGFDVIALIRSTIKNIKAGKVVQGASTITQQITRILFLSQEKTFTRKFKELVLAHRLEKTVSKDKILELYLNNVYLGEGAYGISGAADIYFDKKVKDLNLAECALIAGLPQAPSVYSPYRNLELAKKRRAMVLKRMLEDGHITAKQALDATNSPVILSSNHQANTLKKAPYFVDLVMKELKDKAGLDEDEVIKGGYKIYTTLNYDYQKAAEKSMVDNMKTWGLSDSSEQAALISYDVVSGQILAYIGGKNYSETQFDRVSLAIRQPGSSFKVFIYTTAMEQGLTPFTIYPDAPVRVGDWSPQNYGRKYRGPLPLYKALAISSNVIAAQLIMDVGVSEVVDTAKKMGITTPLEKDPTIALGSNGVKMVDMATAYGVLANGGIKVEPYGIEKVETSNGKVIYLANNDYKRILDVKTVAYMVEMLKQVVKFGTGRASNIDRPSAGKTGTTDSYRDAWFVGFTPDIVTAVWVGNDNNRPTPGLTGGTVPALIWRDYMKVATANKPVMDFMYPEVIMDTNYGPAVPEHELEKLIQENEKAAVQEDKKNNENKENNKEPKVEEVSDREPPTPGDTQEFTPVPIPIKEIKIKPISEVSIPQDVRKDPVGMTGF